MRKQSILFIIFAFLTTYLILPMKKVEAIPPTSQPTYQGIDVSEWQGEIDYSLVRGDGIEVVYIKSSEGTEFVDPYFRRNYENAKANGMKVGFYHYLTARTEQEAEEEAIHFANTISGTVPDCRLAMDFESFGNLTVEQINIISRAFLEKLQEITEKELVIYSDTSNARDVFDYRLAESYPLWVAEYGVSTPGENGKWETWVGFQYTDMGNVAGINGYVDRDEFAKEILLDESTEIPSVPETPEKNVITYVVQSGDTLSSIARRYGTTVAELVELNGISNPDLIFVGEVLKIRASSGSGNNEIIYRIRRGDTLSQIARTYHVSVNTLVQVNGIQNPNLIYVGETLRIPQNGEIHDSGHSIYRIRYGDTLTSIARRFGVNVDSIVELNNIQNPNLIYAGETLRI